PVVPPTTTPPPTTTVPPSVTVAPTASFTWTCNKTNCQFDGSSSKSSVQVKSYAWAFGDGTSQKPQPGPKVSHDYHTKGTYTEVVTLTVVDAAGAVGSVQKTISISAR